MDTINVKEIIGGTQSEDSVVAKNLCNVRLEKRIAQFKVGKGNDGKLILGIFPKDGNNLVVECENLEELKQIANKVILNANKKIVEGKQVSIETSLEGKENKRVRISGMGIPFDAEYQMKIQKYNEEIYELYNSEAKDDNEEIERIIKESDINNKIIEAEKKGEESAIVVDAKQITICGENLEKTRDVADYLVDKSNISTNPDKKVIDFNKNNYDSYTQDILLQHIYNKRIKLTKEQASGIRNFKFYSR